MFSQIDIKKNQIDQKMALVDEFTNETNLNKNIKRKMQKSIRAKTERLAFSVEEKEALMDELPKQLKYEVATKMHNGAMSLFTFFENKDQRFITSVVPFLQPSYISLSDTVYNEGEPSNDIYFIVRGRLNFVFGEENTVFRVLTQGHYFGDIEIYHKTKRMHTVVAGTDCSLLVMIKRVIEIIKRDFPAIWAGIENQAKEREKKTKSALAEMKVLMKANKNGEIRKMTPKEFKNMIESEMKNLEESIEVEKETVEETQKKLVDRLDRLGQEIKGNREAISQIEDILTELLAEEEFEENSIANLETSKTLTLHNLQNTSLMLCK